MRAGRAYRRPRPCGRGGAGRSGRRAGRTRSLRGRGQRPRSAHPGAVSRQQRGRPGPSGPCVARRLPGQGRGRDRHGGQNHPEGTSGPYFDRTRRHGPQPSESQHSDRSARVHARRRRRRGVLGHGGGHQPRRGYGRTGPGAGTRSGRDPQRGRGARAGLGRQGRGPLQGGSAQVPGPGSSGFGQRRLPRPGARSPRPVPRCRIFFHHGQANALSRRLPRAGRGRPGPLPSASGRGKPGRGLQSDRPLRGGKRYRRGGGRPSAGPVRRGNRARPGRSRSARPTLRAAERAGLDRHRRLVQRQPSVLRPHVGGRGRTGPRQSLGVRHGRNAGTGR